MNISDTFIKLTEYVVPHGKENIFEPFLPDGYVKDEIGNYVVIIGESRTMFTCHLDNATHKVQKVKHVFYEEEGRKKVRTDGKTILGSDDKAGMVVMLNMIENKIPGHYYFFVGEERGCIGSSGIRKAKPEYFKESFDRCVSFDRRGYGSIISRQRSDICCSKDFVKALVVEFAKSGMEYKDDPTGIYTDSAQFMYSIPECTNLSCGCFHEHTMREFQNLSYLERVANAVLEIDWENLPIVREAKEPDWMKPRPVVTKRGLTKKPKTQEFPSTRDDTSMASIGNLNKTFGMAGRNSNIKKNQKEKPRKRLLGFGSFLKKKGEELYDTISDYLEFYGYSETSLNPFSKDRNK